MNEFSRCHPLVNFIYFGAVILFSTIFMHPVCLISSAVCVLWYSLLLCGKAYLKNDIRYIVPVMLFAAAINVLFNHKGATILAYFPGGNPLTLESIVYSAAMSVMLGTVLAWFGCFNKIITSDKIIYLFGKAAPSLSLALSMLLRFVPRFGAQIKSIVAAQYCMGKGVRGGSLIQSAKNGMNILSAMITLSLENSVQISLSMKSRGFGKKGRTAFYLYKFSRRDIFLLAAMLLLIIYIAAGALCGGLSFSYFPLIGAVNYDLYTLSLFCAYFALCALPVIFESAEDFKWKSLK